MAEKKDFRKLENLGKKKARSQAQLQFLKKCLEVRIVPKRFYIRCTFRDWKVGKWFTDLSFRIIKKHVNDLYFKIRNIEFNYSRELVNLENVHGKGKIQSELFWIRTKCRNIEFKYKRHLDDKFDLLKKNHRFQEVINHKPKKPEYTIYLTDHALKDTTKKLLENHSKFTLGNTNDSVLNFLADLQAASINEQRKEVKTEISSIMEKIDKNELAKSEIKNKIAWKQYNSAKRDLEDKNLCVVKTDKSNQLAVIPKSVYVDKMEDVIKDLFVELKSDGCSKINQKLKTLLKGCGGICDNFAKKLTNNSASTPSLFGFIKTHKQNAPIRPVVTLKGGPLEKIDKWLLQTLKFVIDKPINSLKNSEELVKHLEKLKKGNNNQFKLFSLDIKSMYPSIPSNFVLDNINKCIQLKEAGIYNKFGITGTQLMKILEFYLDSIEISFNGKFYRQREGLSIGSSCSPILAEFAIGIMEDRVLKQFEDMYIFYKRYVDDTILGIKPDMTFQLQAFMDKFNEILPSITLTKEEEVNGVLQFLDVKIIRESSKMDWIYSPNIYKSDAILNYKSDHSKTALNNIAKNMLKRAFKLSSEELRHEAVTNMAKKLINNQYPKKLVLNHLSKIEYYHKANKKMNKDQIKYMGLSYIKDYTRNVKSTNKFLKFVSRNGQELGNIAKFRSVNKNKIAPCIYKINLTCRNCYIGQTGRSHLTRLNEHVRNLKNKNKNSNLVIHMLNCGCEFEKDPIQILHKENNKTRRIAKESIYIKATENCISKESMILESSLEDKLPELSSVIWQQYAENA